MRKNLIFMNLIILIGCVFLTPSSVYAVANNSNQDVMTVQTFFPSPSGFYQDLNVNRILNVTNNAKNATIKADRVKYSFHPYPITPDGNCSPEEEFDTILAGDSALGYYGSTNLHICWKHSTVIPDPQDPNTFITVPDFRWTPAPFSNWAYSPGDNTMYDIPINGSSNFYPNIGIGTGVGIRPNAANLELKNTNTGANFTSFMFSSYRDDHVWGILADYPTIDNPNTTAIDESKSEFKIVRANWPTNLAVPLDFRSLFEINYNRYFGFNSDDPRGLYSFDKISQGGNDSMLLSGVDLVLEYIPPTAAPSPSHDLWRISNTSPADPSVADRPLLDILNFIAINDGVESSALTLWQNKDVNNDTRVGVGTPAPQASLHLAGFGTRSFYIHNGTANQDIGRISFRSGVSGGNLAGAEKSFLYADLNGKIGLNTTTPSESLSVAGQVTLEKSSVIDYAVGSLPYTISGQNTGIRIVSGRVNINAAGNITSTSGTGFIVNKLPGAGRYRIRFVPNLLGNAQNVFCVANLAANLPYFISTVSLNGPQIDVFIIDATNIARDASFNFIVTGPR